MAKKVAVLAVNPVNGYGLFEYLEAFFENGIPFTLYEVADSREIKTNSGISISANDVVANLKGHSDSYDALVFACGDAMPKFGENASAPYNQDLIAVIREFAEKGRIIAGHCAAGLLFDIAGVANGKTLAAHPLAQPGIKTAKTTDAPYAVDGQFYTAQTENTISTLMPELLKALK